MPRKNVTYTCEICGREYAKLETAVTCEQMHKIPEKVRASKYDLNDRKCRFPESVIVEFTDGTSCRYYRGPMHQDD